jgi:rifampicin phosphotransferase
MTTHATDTPANAADRFEPPGPGTWERDISHTTAAPTRLMRRLTTTTMPDAYREVFALFGAPLDTMDIRWVHGAMYHRLVPLVGADSERPPPPAPVMRIALRLHPAFRRRERAARKIWSERPDRAVVDEWYRAERHSWIDRNRTLQAVDPGGLTDDELAAHLEALEAHLVAGWRRHHVLHGSDIGPIGDLLVHGRQWGIPTHELLALLQGASPATTSARGFGLRIAAALRADGVDPATIRSLDEVRVVPEASALLDEYLADAAWHVVSSYDIEAATVGELPAATCALIRSAAAASEDDGSADRGRQAFEAARARVPADEQEQFDALVDYARTAYGMRDDNGPLTVEWPTGLMRRGCLEAGTRLVEQDRLHEANHAFEFDVPEVIGLLRGASTPTADDAVDRAAVRAHEATMNPPSILGPHEPPPDLSLFPRGMRRTMDLVVTAVSLLEVDPTATRGGLNGTGIGDRVHRGTARVATSPEQLDDLFDQMEPGDVLVAPWTAPTFNALFAVAGAVVVREGGPLCHAAVMARELDIPTVIGCTGALEHIHDGDLVEVDPVAGEVRVIESH